MTNRQLAEETSVPLFINGRLLTNLLCTPTGLKDLAFGWLFSQGIIQEVSDIRAVSVCGAAIDVSLRSDFSINDAQRNFRPIEVSGCGGGQINSLQYREDLRPVTSTLQFSVGQCRQALSLMFETLRTSDSGIGLHCAQIVNHADLLTAAFGFDIGRHNAVDKAIGIALQQSVNFEQCLLATSGRISSDMIIKAAVAGIPVVTSPRSVTTLAAELAKRTGIGIAGAMRKPSPVMAGNADRFQKEV